MNQSGYGATAVPHLRGSWNWGAAPTDDMMTDADGDDVWEITKSITGGAEYLFAIKEDAVLFYEDMTNKGYECVCFRVNV